MPVPCDDRHVLFINAEIVPFCASIVIRGGQRHPSLLHSIPLDYLIQESL